MPLAICPTGPQPPHGPDAKRLIWSRLEVLLHLYGDRVLPLDVAAARIAGELSDIARSKGLASGWLTL